MAEANAKDNKYKGFKIFEYAGDKDGWCSEKVAKLGSLNVPMKTGLKSGDYIVRAEIIGLNMAGKQSSEGYGMGAQFFPNCGLVTLTNVQRSKNVPTNTASIPGMYTATNPSLLLKSGIKGIFAASYMIPSPKEYDPPKDGHTIIYSLPLNSAYLKLDIPQ